ncbi:MAG: precorrin-8X methylmutase, partial [Treponema sp.]|nr:precorrin-8X methylmutase [Treponema sp.]
MIEFVKPEEIEARSFEIIANELLERKIELSPENKDVIMRVIHTTADFDFAKTLKFSQNAVSVARKLIFEGAHIVTDTNMAKAGINKRKLETFGGEVHCFMADEDVASEAKSRGLTRAAVSMERAAG